MLPEIDRIVELAAQRKASDVHIVCGLPVKCRIDGNIVDLLEETVSSEQSESFARFLLGDRFEKIANIGEIDIGYTFPCGVRTRGNVYRQGGKISIALRLFPNKIPHLAELGLPECVYNIPKIKNGIVLVTGETGSGKSTTLASIINEINKTKNGHVITLEDPIEYLIDSDKCIITQREIGVDTVSYASGLRSILREDPDVIMVGEMRDLETIETALTAAETGHLVLATLHTNSAADMLDRIVGVFPDGAQAQIRMQLSNTLCYVITQKLLSKKNGEGRVLACEVMVVNSAIRNLIREGKTHQIESFLTLSKNEGSISMDSALLELVKKELISFDLGMQYAKNKDNFKYLFETSAPQSEKRSFLSKR